MKRLLTLDQFARLAPDDQGGAAIATQMTGSAEPSDSGRVVRYLFSTPAVGRDMHTVAASAWRTANFEKNPVFLWAHDDTMPPIGRVTAIETVGDALRGAVEYIDRDISPFADMIYRMVRSGFVNAVSTSWMPLKWNLAKERGREGGLDFTDVDLLEISQVPIPAMPNALATARSAGIDTVPMYAWAERMLDSGGYVAVPRGELEELHRAAKMPARSKNAAAGRTDAPDAIGAPNAPQTNEETPGMTTKTTTDDPKRTLRAAHQRFLASVQKPKIKRGLYGVAQLACVMNDLGYCKDAAEWEAALEEDNSPVPAMLGEALQALGAALLAMTEEEIRELLAEGDEGEDGDEVSDRRLGDAVRRWVGQAATPLRRTWRRAIAHYRDGREASTETQEHLAEAQEHHRRALKHHRELGANQEQAGEHLAEARGEHREARAAHDAVGESLKAAKANPGNAQEHVARALEHHEEADEHMGALAEAHRNLADRHEDAMDNHRCLGRSVKAAVRSVRAAQGASTTEPDSEGSDELEDDQEGKEGTAPEKVEDNETRARRARALQLLIQKDQ